MADKPQKDAGRIDAITAAHGLFTAYGDAISRLDAALGAPFTAAVDMILDADGHVVVCGMGKSGLIGRKIAATLASTAHTMTWSESSTSRSARRLPASPTTPATPGCEARSNASSGPSFGPSF